MTTTLFESRILCRRRLNEISPADLGDLTRFAQWRLETYGSHGALGADTAQSAFESVMRGLETDQGRRPRTADLVDHVTFMKYLRGVVASKTEALTRRRNRCVSVDDIPESAILGDMSPAQHAELSDLKLRLFAYLKERAPARLLPTIVAWEKVFASSDRIPSVDGQRKYVGEVKKLAQEIVQEFSWFKSLQGGES